MQSTKQRVNSLIKYAQIQEEKELVKAIGDVRLKDITKEDADRLIEVVGKWGFYMGSTARLSSDDILMLCKFLRENYDFLTISELHLAINLNLKGQFGQIEYYGNLTPVFMSNVLNAYLEYKREHLKSVFTRKEKEELPSSPQLNRDELLQMTKDAFRLEYAKYKKSGVIDDLFSIVYTFLEKNNRIKIDDEVNQKALEYANRMAQKDVKVEAKNLGDLIRNAMVKDDSIRHEKHYKNFIVIYLFSTINNIDEYVDGISINEIL